MVARKNYVRRTVQYWRLVDARSGERVQDQDWDSVLRRFISNRTRHVVDSRGQAGTSYVLSVAHDWQDALAVGNTPGTVQRQNAEATVGLVLASDKDYIPNQEHTGSGEQQAMQLAGEEWQPVDNLFVWFLPFGNMFAVLAESVSASRAATFADWLTKATRDQMGDHDFAWAARPVIDATRAQLLADADGLKAAVYAGEFGQAVNDASGVRSIFGGPHREPKALRIEIKASLVRGKSGVGDEALLLDWFNRNFGSLQGSVDKAQVTVVSNEDTPVTEVDLLHHRVTRKTDVRIATGATRAFTPVSAIGSIIEAFVLDRPDLWRLRSNDD